MIVSFEVVALVWVNVHAPPVPLKVVVPRVVKEVLMVFPVVVALKTSG